jgi:hypothetical protein
VNVDAADVLRLVKEQPDDLRTGRGCAPAGGRVFAQGVFDGKGIVF